MQSAGVIARRCRAHRPALFAALLPIAAPAQAHLVSTGMGPVYDAAVHVLLSPETVAPLIALAMLAGLRGADHARASLFAVTGAWLAGAWLLPVPSGSHAALGPAGACLVLGVLIAADMHLTRITTTAFAIAVGLWGGAANPVAGLVGSDATVFVLSALVASSVVPLRAPVRFAVRVAGSWIGALGLLMAGWAIRAQLSS